MGLGEAVATCYRRYATFGGRSRRSEFWWFHLYGGLVWVPTIAAFAALWGHAFEGSLTGPEDDPAINPDVVGWGSLTAAFGVLVLYLLVVTVPMLAVTARRLHDVGQSGAWVLLVLVGLGVVPLAMGVIAGQRGSNRYGPDPVAVPLAAPA